MAPRVRVAGVSFSSRRLPPGTPPGRAAVEGVTEIITGRGLSMLGRSGRYRGLAGSLAVTGMLGAALVATTSCSAGQPATLPQASCGHAGTHGLSGSTQFYQADKGALTCFATAARQCKSGSIAITEMGVDTGTNYVFGIAPGKAPCQATEWSQYYSANGGGSQGSVVV